MVMLLNALGIGFAAWVVVLLILWGLDAVWTHGLATSYLSVTSSILIHLWSFVQSMFTYFQRLIAMAPRALQIFIFFIMGTLIFGVLLNWFMAATVVCASPETTPYEGGLMDVWIAKSLSVDNASNSLIYGNVPDSNGCIVENGNCFIKQGSFGSNLGSGWCDMQTTKDGCRGINECSWEEDVTCGGVKTHLIDGQSVEGECVTVGVCSSPGSWPAPSESFCANPDYRLHNRQNCIDGECNWNEQLVCEESQGVVQSGLSVSVDGAPMTYDVDDDVKQSNDVLKLFSLKSRNSFVADSIKDNPKSFTIVNNSGVVTYTCNKSADVEIGLFGLKNILSLNTMIYIMVLSCFVWGLKFFGVF
jgi:hypothetical protein